MSQHLSTSASLFGGFPSDVFFPNFEEDEGFAGSTPARLRLPEFVEPEARDLRPTPIERLLQFGIPVVQAFAASQAARRRRDRRRIFLSQLASGGLQSVVGDLSQRRRVKEILRQAQNRRAQQQFGNQAIAAQVQASQQRAQATSSRAQLAERQFEASQAPGPGDFERITIQTTQGPQFARRNRVTGQIIPETVDIESPVTELGAPSVFGALFPPRQIPGAGTQTDTIPARPPARQPSFRLVEGVGPEGGAPGVFFAAPGLPPIPTGIEPTPTEPRRGPSPEKVESRQIDDALDSLLSRFGGTSPSGQIVATMQIILGNTRLSRTQKDKLLLRLGDLFPGNVVLQRQLQLRELSDRPAFPSLPPTQ